AALRPRRPLVPDLAPKPRMSALTYATAQLLRAMPRAAMGRALGWLADVPWSPAIGRAVVGLYARAYDVSFDECVKAGDFRSFDDFSTRTLRRGARPIDADPRVIVCPADGRAESMGPVDGRTFRVKGTDYEVAELLGDASEAKRYDGGGACVVYLSP